MDMNEKPTYQDLRQRIKALEEILKKEKQIQNTIQENKEKFRILADSSPTAKMLCQDDQPADVISLLDITERIKTKETLQRERDLLQTIMNSAGKAQLVYLDCNFNFVRVNESYAMGCGYRPEEMIGKNHFELYPDAGNKAIFTHVRDTGEDFEVRDKPFEFPDQPERGTTYWDWTLKAVKEPDGQITGLILSLYETTERKKNGDAMDRLVLDLQEALAKVKTLSGFFPICASCKKIRDDKGYWEQIDEYIRDHTDARFSHDICPECARKLYPQLFEE